LTRGSGRLRPSVTCRLRPGRSAPARGPSDVVEGICGGFRPSVPFGWRCRIWGGKVHLGACGSLRWNNPMSAFVTKTLACHAVTEAGHQARYCTVVGIAVSMALVPPALLPPVANRPEPLVGTPLPDSRASQGRAGDLRRRASHPENPSLLMSLEGGSLFREYSPPVCRGAGFRVERPGRRLSDP
jgi:hypothetical protein